MSNLLYDLGMTNHLLPADQFAVLAEHAAANGSPTYKLPCHWCGTAHLVNPAVGATSEPTADCPSCDRIAGQITALFAGPLAPAQLVTA